MKRSKLLYVPGRGNARAVPCLTIVAAPALAQARQQLLDINTTPYPGQGVEPSEMTAALGALYYVAGDDANGRHLRRVDRGGQGGGAGARHRLELRHADDLPAALTRGAQRRGCRFEDWKPSSSSAIIWLRSMKADAGYPRAES